MPNYRNNQYNPYTAQYTNPVEGANVAYQPVYDPSETDRWANLLQERSQRYDIGRQTATDFESQLGGIQTYDPEFVTDRINQFHADVKSMVDTQYGGDYGLASGDIAQKIAREKGNKAYKLMDFQNKQAEEFLQAKHKLGDNLIIKNDPTKSGLLRQAITSNEDPYALLQADYMERPDRVTLANKLIETVNPSGWQSILQGLDKSEREQLSKAGITDPSGLFKQVQYQGVSEKTLNKLKDKFADLLVNQDRSLGYEFGENAKSEASKIIEQAIPLHVWSKSGEDLQNLGFGDDDKKIKKKSGYSHLLHPYKTVGEENLENKSASKYGAGEGKVDLNKPNEAYIGVAKTASSGDPNSPYTFQSIAKSGMMTPEGEEKIKGVKEISEFESRYGNLDDLLVTNGTYEIGADGNPIIDLNKKHAFISNLKDKQNTQARQIISLDNDVLRGKLKNRIGSAMEEYIYYDNGQQKIVSKIDDIDLPGRDKTENKVNFEPSGFNPENGSVVFVNPKNNDQFFEGIPSVEGKKVGGIYKKAVKDLYGDKQNPGIGFSVIPQLNKYLSKLPAYEDLDVSEFIPIVIDQYDPMYPETNDNKGAVVNGVYFIPRGDVNLISSNRASVMDYIQRRGLSGLNFDELLHDVFLNETELGEIGNIETGFKN